jgi:hypothetical protein
MAGTVTVDYSDIRNSGKPVRRVSIDWISDASGDATATTGIVSGTILGVTFNPGSPAPTANYDVTLLDQAGRDVLAGLGANLSATDTLGVCPGQAFTDGTTTSVAPISVNDVLTLAVSNAGDSKAGSIVLHLR